MCVPVKISFEIPEWGVDSTTSERWHNKAVKEIMRDQLTIQKFNRVHRHFEFSAASRYGYTKRTAKYLRTKLKYRGRTTGWNPPVAFASDANLDLVKTGKTRREILNGARITIAGTGSSVLATLRLIVPIPGRTGRQMDLAAQLRLLAAGKIKKLRNARTQFEKGDIVRRTVGEIEKFAQDEVTEINRSVAFMYAERLKKARRVKKK